MTVPPAVGVLRWRFGASRKIIFRLFLQLASHQSNPNVRNFLPVGDLRPAPICSKGAVTRVVVTKVDMSRLSQLGARGRDHARFSGSPGLRSPFAVLDSPVRVPSVCPPSAVVSIATVLGGQPSTIRRVGLPFLESAVVCWLAGRTPMREFISSYPQRHAVAMLPYLRRATTQRSPASAHYRLWSLIRSVFPFPLPCVF